MTIAHALGASRHLAASGQLGASGELSDGELHLSQGRAGEGQWVQAASQGDTAAFARLVQKYQDRLCTSLLHVCGSIHEAEDVAQEAFFQAFKKLPKFAGSSSFYTWLYRIAVNIAITRHRRRRKVSSLECPRVQDGTELHDDGEAAEERVIRLERAAQVRHALDRLNEEHRAILVLREVEGFDYDTIAQVLELPKGTVRSRLHRARLQLRDQLDLVLGTAERHASACQTSSQTSSTAPILMASSPTASESWWNSN